MYIVIALLLAASTPQLQSRAGSGIALQDHIGKEFAFQDHIGKEAVSGTVTDDNGPVQGASVRIKGTTAGAQTDEKGAFKLETDENTITLVVSASGYRTREVVTHPGAPITIRLEKEARL